MEYFTHLMHHILADAVKDYRDEWRKGKDLAELRGVKPTLPGLPYYGETLERVEDDDDDAPRIMGEDCPLGLPRLVQMALRLSQLHSTVLTYDQSRPGCELSKQNRAKLPSVAAKLENATLALWEIATAEMIGWNHGNLLF
jgi:hypothetical protein